MKGREKGRGEEPKLLSPLGEKSFFFFVLSLENESFEREKLGSIVS